MNQTTKVYAIQGKSLIFKLSISKILVRHSIRCSYLETQITNFNYLLSYYQFLFIQKKMNASILHFQTK